MDTKLISREYKELLMQKHDCKPWGGTGHSWVPYVIFQMDKLKEPVKTILDFGCGRGTFRNRMLLAMPHIEVTEYDPGVRGKDKLPNHQFDYVVCTDVMEHVEEDRVPYTLQTIHDHARLGVFFNIECNLSKSFLPDGRNTHITVKKPKWWVTELERAFASWEWTTLERGGRLVIAGATT
jgi:2-polyprenyl-3-methyl-5-hydroxy-6-metoxy-1,4-benzoquinol methylase